MTLIMQTPHEGDDDLDPSPPTPDLPPLAHTIDHLDPPFGSSHLDLRTFPLDNENRPHQPSIPCSTIPSCTPSPSNQFRFLTRPLPSRSTAEKAQVPNITLQLSAQPIMEPSWVRICSPAVPLRPTFSSFPHFLISPFPQSR